MPNIRTYPDDHRLAHAAAEHFVSVAASSIEARGRFSVALSGGSTPRPAYEQLATSEFASRVDWPCVHVFWGDERCVPPDHTDSNYRMAREALIGHVPVPPANVHRIHGEIEPSRAVAQYERTLRKFFADTSHQSATTFDLLLLGMGTDGHTASLFSGSELLEEKSRWVGPHYVASASGWRVTLTPPVINAARQVTFLVSGSAKAETLRRVLAGPQQPHLLPAQIIKPRSGSLLWLLDSDAASRL
jgi:6-phosphogluconolactonase